MYDLLVYVCADEFMETLSPFYPLFTISQPPLQLLVLFDLAQVLPVEAN